MMPGVAGGVAVVSLALPVGWCWLRHSTHKTQLWRNLEQRWLGRTAVFFYFVGLPYFALVFGLLPPTFLGLTGLEHLALISPASLIPGMHVAMTLILIEWLMDSGAIIVAGLATLLILGGIIWSLAYYGIREAMSQASLGDIIYHPVHWAFYWALFWLIMDDRYLGVVLGAGWVILERLLVTQIQGVRLVQQPQLLVDLMILILIAAIFYYRPNLWLLWPIHLAMVYLTRVIQTGAISLNRAKSLPT